MPILINSAAAFYIPSEADITGADATNDGTTTGNASSTIVLPVGFFNTTLPTLTNGQAGALQTDNRGRLIIAPITVNAYHTTTTISRAANTTPYTANDVIGGALTIANAGANAGSVILNSVRLILNISALPSGIGAFHLFLYDVTPPSNVADNGAFTVASGDRASLLTPNGIALGFPVLGRGGGTVVLQANNLALQFKLASTSLFAYLVTENAFTPAVNSETYTLTCQLVGI